jgi:TonB family protein
LKCVTARKHLRCTRCGSPFLRPSHTRIWERPLRLLLLRPYRCRECLHRHYASIWPHGGFQDRLHSLFERQSSPGLTHATDGTVSIGTGRKWMLVYVLLIGLSIVAVASLRIRPGLLNNVSLQRTESSPVTSTAGRQQESQGHEAAAFNSPTSAGGPQRSAEISPVRHASKVPTDLDANAAVSVQSLEQPRSPSTHQDVIASSSAEAIWAQRPKLPPEIKAMITSDNVVEVRVRINAAGKVTDATALFARGPVAPSLVRYARDTARRWRFRPARKSGKPVPCDKVIEFLFRASDT